MENFTKKCFAPDFRKIVWGAFYLILIGVVAYGMNDHVYDGFGKAVPWIIIALFAVMGIVRIAEGITGKNAMELIADIAEKLSGSSAEDKK